MASISTTGAFHILHIVAQEDPASIKWEAHLLFGESKMEDPICRRVHQVAKSQFQIAQKIDFLLPRCLVVLGKSITDIHSNSEETLKEKKGVELIFDKKLPDRFDQLTSLQKTAIYTYGGAHVMLYLGKIKTLYKGINSHSQLQEEILKYAEIKGAFAKKVKNAEKKMALLIEDAIRKSGLQSGTVLALYGGLFSFKSFCGKKRYTYDKIVHIGTPLSTDNPRIYSAAEMGIQIINGEKTFEAVRINITVEKDQPKSAST